MTAKQTPTNRLKAVVKNIISRRVTKYAAVGLISFLTEYLTFVLLSSVLGADYRLANVASMTIAISINFHLNREYVFMDMVEGRSKLSTQFVKYIMLFVFNLIMSTVIIGFLIRLGLADYVAKLISVCMTVSWTFLAYKTIIFRDSKTDREK